MTFSAFKETATKVVFAVTAAVFILCVIVICVFIFARSVPAIGEIGLLEFLFSTEWAPNNTPASYGIGTMIVGTCFVTAGALVIGVPIGLLMAAFMARYCPKPLYKVMKPMTNILAGIPSIVYGYFGMMVIAPLIRDNFGGTGYSILTASIVLGIMILPTVIGVSECVGKRRGEDVSAPKTQFIAPKAGDYVVHRVHGVGLCEGTTIMKGGEFEKEYVVLGDR